LSNAANWVGDVAPLPGYDLIFPATATNFNPVSDFPVGTSFNSITIEASGYHFSGNALAVASNLTTTYTSGTSTALDLGLDTGEISVAGGMLQLSLSLSTGPQVIVSGGGALDWVGGNIYTGTTTITGPTTTLLVDTAEYAKVGDVSNHQGVLGGSGTVSDVTDVGGTVAPGHSLKPGVLTTGSLSLDSSSTFVTELDGSSPGNGATGYSQVVATGAVSLGGAALNVTLGPDYSPAPGDQLTIIQNKSGSAVSGTFANHPEGSIVTVGSALFRITYQGGASGHDVVLTPVSTRSSITISSSTSSIRYGQTITFTATVTGNQGTPTGSVAFFDGNPGAGGTELDAPVALNSSGVATDTIRVGASSSAQRIYAVYIPDPSTHIYAGSTSTTPVSVTVAPVTLTVSGLTVAPMIYNATPFATLDISRAALSGVLGNDQVSVSPSGYTAIYSSPNVGTNIPVSVTGLSLTGSAAGNYVLIQPTGLSGDITTASTQTRVQAVSVKNRRGKSVKVELEAQVAVMAPGGGTLLGSLTFFVNGRRGFSRTVPVVNGMASLTMPSSGVLKRTVFARYLGDDTSYQPSVSTGLLVTRRTLRSTSTATRKIAKVRPDSRVSAGDQHAAAMKAVVRGNHGHHSR
jgi:hypothetical protein